MAITVYPLILVSPRLGGRISTYLQKLVRKTATLLKRALMLTIPQAMRAANFSSTQSADLTLKMRVRRALKKTKVDDIPPPNNVELTSPMPTVSTLTTPPTVAAAGGVSVATMPTTTTAETGGTSNNLLKIDAIRLTATEKAKDDEK
jgi:hypothetical protein